MVGAELLFMDEPGRPVGRAKRLARAAFVFALFTIPLALIVVEDRKAAEVHRWPVVSCTVVSSGVEVDSGLVRDHPYHTTVAFQFDFAGRPRVGHRLAVGKQAGTGDAADAYAGAGAFPVGSRHQCHVDADDPSESVLVHPAPWWEPLLEPAILVALSALATLYCGRQVWLAITAPGRPAPPRDAVARRVSGYLWGGLFFVGAGSFVAVGWVVPLARTASAAHWTVVPCAVEASRVQQETIGGEVPITSYRTDVLFRYAVAGRTYHSNCYSLTETGSPSRGGRDRAAAMFPAGRSTVCYVDPADPTVATLTRHVSPTIAFAAWPMAIALLGLVGLIDGGVGRTSKALAAAARRRRVTLAAVAVSVVAATVWGVFAMP